MDKKYKNTGEEKLACEKAEENNTDHRYISTDASKTREVDDKLIGDDKEIESMIHPSTDNESEDELPGDNIY